MYDVAKAARLPGLLGMLLVAAVIFGFTPKAAACSVCACGDPLLAASDPAAITGQLRLQIDTEYYRMSAGTEGLPGFTDHLTQWSYRLNAVYRPIRRLSLIATIPVLDKAIRTVGGGTDETASHLIGLGDAELGARYSLWRSVNYGTGRVHEFAVAGGAMIPSGAHNAKSTDATTGEEILIDPHGQLGTGGWGPFLGLHYRIEQSGWMGFADASYRIRTTGSYSDGSKYNFGDAVLWSVHGQYRLLPTLAIDFGIDGRYARMDTATARDPSSGSHAENTGGMVLSASPGAYANVVGGLWVFVRAQFPFYERLGGEQDVKPSIAFGMQYQVL